MKRVLFLMLFLFFLAGCEKKEIPLGNLPGAQIYHGITRSDVRCFRCHGPIGEGSSAPALVKDGKTIDPALFVKTVLDGRNRMPPFASVLSEVEIKSIIDWLEKVHKKTDGNG